MKNVPVYFSRDLAVPNQIRKNLQHPQAFLEGFGSRVLFVPFYGRGQPLAPGFSQGGHSIFSHFLIEAWNLRWNDYLACWYLSGEDPVQALYYSHSVPGARLRCRRGVWLGCDYRFG